MIAYVSRNNWNCNISFAVAYESADKLVIFIFQEVSL